MNEDNDGNKLFLPSWHIGQCLYLFTYVEMACLLVMPASVASEDQKINVAPRHEDITKAKIIRFLQNN